MKILEQVLRILVICVLGEVVANMLTIPFPGSVLAMIILFLCLIFKLIKVEQIDIAADFLLKNMVLLFIPSTVSIISYVDILEGVVFKFLFICIITTIITFFCTAYSVKLTMYIIDKLKGGTK